MISKLFAHQIEPEQLQQLRDSWNRFDVDKNGSLTFDQFRNAMKEYDHGYREDQVEAMFDSLDWNETQRIRFDDLVTAFSYQRLVAVDERLWEAFATLDDDNDGLITKLEIKKVLRTLDKDNELHLFDAGLEKLEEFKPADPTPRLYTEHSDDDTFGLYTLKFW